MQTLKAPIAQFDSGADELFRPRKEAARVYELIYASGKDRTLPRRLIHEGKGRMAGRAIDHFQA